MFQNNNISQHSKLMSFLYQVLIVSLILQFSDINAAPLSVVKTEKSIELSNNNEFTYLHFKAKSNTKIKSDTVALWVVPGYPHLQRFHEFSQRLAENGVEVWMVNILDNLFMQRGANSIRQLTGDYVAELIEIIHQKTNKKVILIAESYSAIPVLRGAHKWQFSEPSKRYLTGAVLFSPNLFESIPSLGEQPKFVDVASNTTIPILLYQSEKSNTRGQLQKLLTLFQKTNASVYTSLIKNSIAIFYIEDKTPETLKNLKTLPIKIVSSLNLLESSPLPLFNDEIKPQSLTDLKSLNSELKIYKAKNSPLKIDLKDVFGNQYSKNNYKNQITIINFWATWCKPCLEEIPSLNRLKAQMKNKPFEIISINYAESPKIIKQFMKRVKVNYPILIDESGAQAVDWNVFAFPSTFVIGPDGEFKYGVNASIYWDTTEVIRALNKLLPSVAVANDK